jgi:hypothetical protein
MRTLDEIERKLWELKDEYVDYDEDIFDNIYYQLCGLAEGYDDESDEALMRDLNELVDQLQTHLDYLKKKPDFNWIFG